MGFVNEGRLFPWGDPLSLIRFPYLTLLQKLRYGLFAFISVRRDHWPSIETENAREWIIRWCGRALYDRFWHPLFRHKFYEYADNISAAWIWTRIRRIGRSRRNIFQEELGYIEGGSLTLIHALCEGIRNNGGRIHLGEGAQRVMVQSGKVIGVRTAQRTVPADSVICTIATPLVNALIPDLPEEWKRLYDAIHNIGVICVIFKLSRSLSPYFWVNVSEPDLEIPGAIEFSKLRPLGENTVVYVPFYMPVMNIKFTWPDERFLDEAFTCLQRINPAITKSDIRATKVSRLRYGQPICEPGFASRIPPVQTPIGGLQIADTCYYYPEDRGIAESVRLGTKMAMNSGVIDTEAIEHVSEGVA